ncbi:methyltransferase domain-containing protein [Wenzhouxiangella marina]|uniref:Small RNA 2'-O-methyltransferase n=1 Tax=Wenzhouxiangella marina TaxID=1579979 RepID=A0A0K0XS10_9GAMM|nr:methyltransferase domain-containing protein [Wenzhouxiangella marina]AKS40407.1 Type 12 methyltransferase [Wenzhouxiangella marina]MBB6088271.1 3' terminal RNA ribose 2'-O-methyltransferase Hen1 [Wenzhouxiangella marina]
MLTALHEQRLEAVYRALLSSGARSVLDLGCGSGSLLARLLESPRFERLLGMDRSELALAALRQTLDPARSERLRLVQGSWTDYHPDCLGHEAACLVETIEHLDPRQLSGMEALVFERYGLATIVLTTPNADHNPLLGLGPGEFRDPDHRFEWSRQRFRRWCRRVAERYGYRLRIDGIGEEDPEFGAPTQMAVFSKGG